MREKIESFNNGKPYTSQDAERDMRAERADLHQQYAAGQIDGEMLGIMVRQTADYLGYVTPDVEPEALEIADAESGPTATRPQ